MLLPSHVTAAMVAGLAGSLHLPILVDQLAPPSSPPPTVTLIVNEDLMMMRAVEIEEKNQCYVHGLVSLEILDPTLTAILKAQLNYDEDDGGSQMSPLDTINILRSTGGFQQVGPLAFRGKREWTLTKRVVVV